TSGRPSMLAEVPNPPMKTVSSPAASTSRAVKTSWAPRLRMTPGACNNCRSRCVAVMVEGYLQGGSLGEDGDDLDLDEPVRPDQGRDADEGAGGRLVHRDVLAADLAEHRHLFGSQTDDVDVHLDHVAEGRPDCGQGLLEVLVGLAGLGSQVPPAHDLPAFVHGHLAGDIHRLASRGRHDVTPAERRAQPVGIEELCLHPVLRCWGRWE